MTLMMSLGATLAVILVFIYLKNKILAKENYIDFFIVMLATLFFGILFAMLFENLYEAIKHAINNEPQAWTWNKTFYGGLFGGVGGFFLFYYLYYLKVNDGKNVPFLKEMLVIAPSAICLGHGIGRIGCFLNGCCYGISVESPLAVDFPNHQHVLPTQLYEMAFLLVLAAVLAVFAFKSITKDTMAIYLISYGIFRFLLEFIRGDERGQMGVLSPSQYWCILLLVVGIVLIFLDRKYIFKKDKGTANNAL